MKYRGFNEAYLHGALTELRGLGLRPTQAYPILHLAGAKWRSVQTREKREDEVQDRRVAIVLHHATVAFMHATMEQNRRLLELSRGASFEDTMLLAVSLSFRELASTTSPLVGPWLRSGNLGRRRAVLAFALGASIVVEPSAIDAMTARIVRARYADPLARGEDPTSAILSLIERVGNAGYALMNPVDAR